MLQAFFHLIQASLNAITDQQKIYPKRTYYLNITSEMKDKTCVVNIVDNGSDVTHEYERDSSIAFTIAKMLIEANGGNIHYAKKSLATHENENTFTVTL